MRMRVATWNINSVRLRLPLVLRFLSEQKPDVLCLQELKAREAAVPREEIAAAGYAWTAIRGEPGYNGVLTASRIPIRASGHHDFCGRGDARHVEVELENGIRIANYYVPAGGDEPDPEANPKFAHKLAFVEEMAEVFRRERGRPTVLVGDLNIAPLECDVWSHRQLRNVVSHTEPEITRLETAMQAGAWTDAVRERIPPPERLYSWWSYRARDWSASDRGRRLDHIWVSPELHGAVRDARILRDVRGWERPSDHAPVVAELQL